MKLTKLKLFRINIAVFIFTFCGTSAVFAQPAAIAHWKLDGTSGSVLDASGNGYNGTNYNATRGVDGVSSFTNDAFDFDGTDDYVSMGNVLNFERTDKFSLSAWVYVDDLSSHGTIISKHYGDSNFRGYILFFTQTGEFRFILRNDYATNNALIVETSSTFAAAEWHHVAVTYDGSSSASGAKIFINGVDQSLNIDADNLSGTIQSDRNFLLGSRNAQNLWLDGKIDEVKIFDLELTESNVIDVYNEGITGPGGGSGQLLAHWKLDGASGPVIDATGNGYDGTNYNATRGVNGVSSFTNDAFDFDGTDDYVSMGNILNFERTDNFSLSAWVYVDDLSSHGSIISKHFGDSNFRGYILFFTQTGEFRFILRNDYATNNALIVETSSTFNIAKWHHVVVTYDGSSSASGANIFIDGVDQSLNIDADNLSGTIQTDKNFLLGSRNAQNLWLDGRLDEVKIFDWKLPESDVLTLFNEATGGGATPTCSDGQQNGDETGIDCGGSCPTTCPPGGSGLWTTNGLKIHYNSGNVGIGITNPPAKLTVNGAILGTQIKVKTDVSTFPDFVFDPDYPLMTITEVDNYIQTHGHLPDIPTAEEAVTDGHDIGAMNLKLLQKIEELTLYVIEQENQIDELRISNAELRMSNDERDQKINHLQLITQDLANKIILLNK